MIVLYYLGCFYIGIMIGMFVTSMFAISKSGKVLEQVYWVIASRLHNEYVSIGCYAEEREAKLQQKKARHSHPEHEIIIMPSKVIY